MKFLTWYLKRCFLQRDKVAVDLYRHLPQRTVHEHRQVGINANREFQYFCSVLYELDHFLNNSYVFLCIRSCASSIEVEAFLGEYFDLLTMICIKLLLVIGWKRFNIPDDYGTPPYIILIIECKVAPQF